MAWPKNKIKKKKKKLDLMNDSFNCVFQSNRVLRKCLLWGHPEADIGDGYSSQSGPSLSIGNPSGILFANSLPLLVTLSETPGLNH